MELIQLSNFLVQILLLYRVELSLGLDLLRPSLIHYAAGLLPPLKIVDYLAQPLLLILLQDFFLKRDLCSEFPLFLLLLRVHVFVKACLSTARSSELVLKAVAIHLNYLVLFLIFINLLALLTLLES